MKKISVTCERKEDIALLKEAGADEVIVALEGEYLARSTLFQLRRLKNY